MIQLARRAGAAALAAALLAAPAALAADKPVPCNGKPLGTDPAGDAFVGFVGLVESPVPAGPNTDFTSVFINSADGKVTVNYSIADLSTTVPPDATSIGYRMNYEVGAVTNYLQVSIDSAGTVAYSYGHSETSGLVKDGDTTGALFEGKEGVMSIVVPPTHGGKTGAKMAGIDIFSAYVRGRVNTQTDQMPDGDAELAYNGAECPKGATPPPASPPSGGGSDGGSGSSGGGSTPPPSSPPPASATAPLKVTATPTKLKLKKIKKAKKATFSLSSSEELTNVAVAFQKGSKTIGSKRLAKLSSKAKVALKLKGKLKKGAYRLVVTGRRADGSTGSVVIKIRVA